MSEVLFLHETGARSAVTLRDSMYCLRHRVFKERLGWNVTSVKGRERDVYDELKPLYLLCPNQRNEVEGCWRLMPTTGPYLLKDIFPQLLYGHPAPEDPAVWEISRFAVQPAQKGYRSLAGVHEITGSMFARLFEFGLAHGIDRIVGVTDVICERLLYRAGVFIQRFGPPQKIGPTVAVAGWLDVTTENFERVDALRAAAVSRRLRACGDAAKTEEQLTRPGIYQ